ncbi:putative riboflavin transporter 2 [Paratrimastix pyriformis]|uniref:Riboflavin transporter 2 n=1 Tax=Paratrimastix pyriformis TaxID=342808 RepID=A0ABQ8US73_9EUKA|nr:putative riboflavin transporter 2 [Paratrimastix pyriformis]
MIVGRRPRLEGSRAECVDATMTRVEHGGHLGKSFQIFLCHRHIPIIPMKIKWSWAFVGDWTLFFFLGFGPFLLVNALWAEMPFYVAQQPEKDSIATWVSSVYNIGNIFPLLYMAMMKYFPRIHDFHVLASLFILGIGASVLLAIFSQSVVGGISLILYMLTLVAGMIGCTGIVSLFAYASQFPSRLTSSFSAGMAGSGIVVTGIALLQGGGSTPAFSPGVFYVIVTILAALPVAALLLIEWRNRKALREGRVPFGGEAAPAQTSAQAAVEVAPLMSSEEEAGTGATPEATSPDALAGSPALSDAEEGKAVTPAPAPLSRKALFVRCWGPLLNIFLTSFFTYMMMPGSLPYALKPFASYGILYETANLLFQVLGMVGRLSVGFFTFRWPSVLNGIQGGSYLFCFITAACGVAHAFLPTGAGWLVVVLVAAQAWLNGYIATVVYLLARERLDAALVTENRTMARWLSLFNQWGCLMGTYFLLILVKAGVFPTYA